MEKSLDYFQVTNGVRQGGVLSPILFTIYFDSLFECLQASGRGCYWDNHFAGALSYADDLTILAPSPDALRKMIADCEAFGQSHEQCFNAAKTRSVSNEQLALCNVILALMDNVWQLLTLWSILVTLFSLICRTSLTFIVLYL